MNLHPLAVHFPIALLTFYSLLELASWGVWQKSALGAFSRIMLNPWVSKFLALLTMLMLMTVGALGGAMVYGPDVDPVVNFLYHLFFPR